MLLAGMVKTRSNGPVDNESFDDEKKSKSRALVIPGASTVVPIHIDDNKHSTQPKVPDGTDGQADDADANAMGKHMVKAFAKALAQTASMDLTKPEDDRHRCERRRKERLDIEPLSYKQASDIVDMTIFIQRMESLAEMYPHGAQYYAVLTALESRVGHQGVRNTLNKLTARHPSMVATRKEFIEDMELFYHAQFHHNWPQKFLDYVNTLKCADMTLNDVEHVTQCFVRAELAVNYICDLLNVPPPLTKLSMLAAYVHSFPSDIQDAHAAHFSTEKDKDIENYSAYMLSLCTSTSGRIRVTAHIARESMDSGTATTLHAPPSPGIGLRQEPTRDPFWDTCRRNGWCYNDATRGCRRGDSCAFSHSASGSSSVHATPTRPDNGRRSTSSNDNRRGATEHNDHNSRDSHRSEPNSFRGSNPSYDEHKHDASSFRDAGASSASHSTNHRDRREPNSSSISHDRRETRPHVTSFGTRGGRMNTQGHQPRHFANRLPNRTRPTARNQPRTFQPRNTESQICRRCTSTYSKTMRHSLARCPTYTGCRNCGARDHVESQCRRRPQSGNG